MKNTQLTDKKVWLAPLAGYTDKAFRVICKDFGADVVVSEMISADGVAGGSLKTKNYADFTDYERPFGIQLFGSKPKSFAKAIETLSASKPDFFDINMGCPVKKVVKRGAGSALLENLPLATQIISTSKKALANTAIPLTVKIRSGFSNLNFLEAAKMFEDAGVDAIVFHPRTQKQMFSGMSDWRQIEQLKKQLKIPVVGNGDITTVSQIEKMFCQTSCDSVMIGRGAVGRPWIFAKTDSVSTEMIFKTIERHFELLENFSNSKKAVQLMKKHICAYLKGLKNSTFARDRVVRMETRSEMLGFLLEFLQED